MLPPSRFLLVAQRSRTFPHSGQIATLRLLTVHTLHFAEPVAMVRSHQRPYRRLCSAHLSRLTGPKAKGYFQRLTGPEATEFRLCHLPLELDTGSPNGKSPETWWRPRGDRRLPMCSRSTRLLSHLSRSKPNGQSFVGNLVRSQNTGLLSCVFVCLICFLFFCEKPAVY